MGLIAPPLFCSVILRALRCSVLKGCSLVSGFQPPAVGLSEKLGGPFRVEALQKKPAAASKDLLTTAPRRHQEQT